MDWISKPRRMRSSVSLAFAVMIASVTPGGAADVWQKITDPENNLSVEYPASIFRNFAGPTDRYAGKRFVAPDEQAEFAYYAFDNRLRETPAKYLKRTLVVQKSNLVYKRITGRFFVISSVRNKRIFYSRCNFGSTVKCIYLEYPASKKRAWDRAVARISSSLR